MRIRVKLLGDGSPEHPFHAQLPTYSMIEVDYDAMVCVVDVPDEDVPSPDLHPRPIDVLDNQAVVGRQHVSPAARADWHKRLNKRYREHTGRFRPELA